MVGRGQIADRAWEQIEPLLPRVGGKRGGQWRDHRTVINGILWKLRTGSPWCDLPEKYGPWQTCFDRFNRWRRDGTWDRLLTHAQANSGAVGDVEWEVSVDDTVIRAHQHAAGARREPAKNEGYAKGGSRAPKMRLWDAREAGSPPRYISLATGRGVRYPWSSPLGSVMEVRSSSDSSTRYVCRVLRAYQADRASVPPT